MIVISSFYNEQYLLPWWLKWHRKIFDHGVLINYFSTDRSREIIEEICPDWEIRHTKYKYWNFKDNDEEFMEVEREFNEYKIVLTTSEFLVGNFEKLSDDLTLYACHIKKMVDDEPKNKPTHKIPLIQQKQSGLQTRRNKYRFLHNYPDGDYIARGRHKTGHDITFTDKMCVWKYAYSPWTEEFIQRKLHMKDQLDPNEEYGKHHRLTRKQLQKEYERLVEKL